MCLVILFSIRDQFGLSQVLDAILPFEVEFGGGFVQLGLFDALVLEGLEFVRGHEG